ncbi:MAG: hypothetical protein JWO36_5397 [Myxococcales bacterium]|nr:hypothetical protein [Myxococcales bacterium]
MSVATYSWLKAAHVIGVFLWMGGLFSVYWLLRIHAQAPKDAHEKLTLMERSLAMMMDIAATLAIGCGVTLAVTKNGWHPTSTIFSAPGAGWFHIKLTLVVLGILSVHGLVRARVAKFSRGEVGPVPGWAWSVLLASVAAIIVLVFVGPLWFAPTIP